MKNTQGVKYLLYHSLTWVGEVTMLKHFTLEYWKDSRWYVGKLKEVPGVFSQGKSLHELEENIRDAYYLMVEETAK